MYWGIALLATMAMTIGCQKDDEEEYTPTTVDLKSAKLTEEMRTGFEFMGLLGEWTIKDKHRREQPEMSSPVKLYFHESGQVLVEVPDNLDYFLKSGIYTYTFEPIVVGSCGGGRVQLKRGNETIEGSVLLNELSFRVEDRIMKMINSFTRERTIENDIPFFFGWKEALPFISGDSEHQNEYGRLHVVNSQEELKHIYYGDEELPQIDFNRYTLIVAWVHDSSKDMTLDKVELKKNGQGYDFNLSMTSKKHYGCVVGYENHLMPWRLYPKLDSNNVSLHVEETFVDDDSTM